MGNTSLLDLSPGVKAGVWGAGKGAEVGAEG